MKSDEKNQENNQTGNQASAFGKERGSGFDANSDTDRLEDPENLQDKTIEDTFPASDAPSFSHMTAGAPESQPETLYGDDAPELSEGTSEDHSGGGRSPFESRVDSRSELPKDFKNDPAAQFAYGRRVEQRTHHFDSSSDRLYRGNPDIGEVDLGTIQADQPSQRDDHDHFDGAGPNPERDRGL